MFSAKWFSAVIEAVLGRAGKGSNTGRRTRQGRELRPLTELLESRQLLSASLYISGPDELTEGNPSGYYAFYLSDPEPNVTYCEWNIDWGDGQFSSGQATGSTYDVAFDHGYANDNGNYMISAQVVVHNDMGGGIEYSYSYGSAMGTPGATKAVNVSNIAPGLSISGPGDVDAGSDYVVAASTWDVSADTVSWTIDWGDGSSSSGSGDPGYQTHMYSTYSAGSDYYVSLTAWDEDGGTNGTYVPIHVRWDSYGTSYSSYSGTLSVTGDGTALEGYWYTLYVAYSDPFGSSLEGWAVDWGEGAGLDTSGASLYYNTDGTQAYGPHFLHFYADGDSPSTRRNIIVEGYDWDYYSYGLSQTMYTASQSVDVKNLAPDITLSGPEAINAGQAFELGVNAFDYGQDAIFRWTIDWGDGTSDTYTDVSYGGTYAPVFTHVYANSSGQRAVQVIAEDEDGTYSSYIYVDVFGTEFEFVVEGPEAVAEGETFTLSPQITNPGGIPVDTIEVLWGDGSTQTYYPSGGVFPPLTHAFYGSNSGESVSIQARVVSGQDSHWASPIGVYIQPMVSIWVTDPWASEIKRDPGAFVIWRSGSLSSELDVYYRVETGAGLAEEGVDYVTLDQSGIDTNLRFVRIPAGQSSATISILPLADLATGESGEDVALTLVDAPAGAFDGYFVGTSTASLTIGNAANGVSVTSTESTTSVASNPAALPGVFTLTRFGDTSEPLTVGYEVGGTAPTSTHDLRNGTVVFAPGQTVATVELRAVTGSPGATPQTATLSLSDEGSYSYSYSVVGDSAAEVTIYQKPTVWITTSSSTVAEGQQVQLTVHRSGDLTQPLNVCYELEGSATLGVDYTGLPATFLVPAGSATAQFAISANPDDELGEDDRIEITLTEDTQGNYAVRPGSKATLQILDEPRPLPEISFEVLGSVLSTLGSNAVEFVVRRTGYLVPLSLGPLVFGGEAIPGVHFIPSITQIDFPDGVSEVRGWIFPGTTPAQGDRTIEMQLPPILDRGILVTPPNQNITVTDNPIVSVTAKQPKAWEGGVPGVFEFSVNHTVPYDLIVNFSVGGGAEGGIPGTPEDADYWYLPAPVTIPANTPSVIQQVIAWPDGEAEDPDQETVTVTVQAGAGYEPATDPMHDYYPATVHILDDYSIDLDVDSDNDSPAGTPSRNWYEDWIEDQTQEPGKYVFVNDNDDDNDRIPDFADGFNLKQDREIDVADDRTVGERFTPIQFWMPYDLGSLEFDVVIDYSASDPAQVQRFGTGTFLDPYTYALPQEGHLRLWTEPGSAARDKRSVASGGDYIAPGVYSMSQLGITAGDDVQWWIEGVRGHENWGDDRTVSIELRPKQSVTTETGCVVAAYVAGQSEPSTVSGPEPDQSYNLFDKVRIGVVGGNLSVDSDNTSLGDPEESLIEDVIEADERRPGKYIVVNDGDKDQDGVPDFADGILNDGMDGINTEERLLPMPVAAPEGVDFSKARFKFVYDDAPPSGLQAHGEQAEARGYSAGEGILRLWKLNGQHDHRDPRPISDPSGNYIGDGQEYTSAQLGLSCGWTTLWLEAVAASKKLGGETIEIWLDPDGSGPAVSGLVDVVRLTAMQDHAADSFVGPVRVSDGTVSVSATDFAVGGVGGALAISRNWTNEVGIGLYGPGGLGTSFDQLPYLIQGTNSVIIVQGGSYQYFDYKENRTQDGSKPDFLPRFGNLNQLKLVQEGNLKEYELLDTAGSRLRFHSTRDTVPMYQRGMLKEAKDPAGNVTTVTYPQRDADSLLSGRVDTISCQIVTPTSTVINELKFNYILTGKQAGLVSSIVLTRDGTVRTVEYTYDESGGADVNEGAAPRLQTITLKKGETVLEKSALQYKGKDKETGRWLLKSYVDPVNGARMSGNEAFTTDDAKLKKQATFFLEYKDGEPRVQSLHLQGAGKLAKEGAQAENRYSAMGEFKFTYTPGESSRAAGFNVWKSRTAIVEPGKVDRVVYTNFASQTMLDATKGDGNKHWASFTVHDKQGRVVLDANPSAVEFTEGSSVTGYSQTPADILDRTGSSPTAYSGIHDDSGLITRYEYFEGATGGGAPGRLKSIFLQRGRSGAPVPQESYTYVPRTHNNNVIYVLESESIYPNGTPITTSYAYDLIQEFLSSKVTTTLPLVSTDQNGTGVAATTVQLYDYWGRPTIHTDEKQRRYITEYDPITSAVSKQIVDEGDATHLNLTTTYDNFDELGRPQTSTSPGGLTTNIVYTDTDKERTVTATGPDGIPRVTRNDLEHGVIESYTGPDGSPYSFTRDWLGLGGRVYQSDRYAVLTGKPGLNHAPGASMYRTSYDFDEAGLQTKFVDAMGTITRTAFDKLGRPTSTWVGTNDTGWDPAKPHDNMVMVSSNIYDTGQVGDGNVTTSTLYPNNGTANRTTTSYYDWRNRLVASSDGIALTYLTLDNLGRVTEHSVFAASSSLLQTVNGVPQPPLTGQMAKSGTQYDNRGQVFVSTVFEVPGTHSLVTHYHHDVDGTLTKTVSPDGLVTESGYDAAGRVIWTTVGSSSVVLERTTTTYDTNSNPTFIVHEQRLPSTPAYRITYAGNWYDAAGRLSASVDYGTTSPPSGVRPVAPPTERTDSILLTSYNYSNQGRLGSKTDPKGAAYNWQYDALGRTIQEETQFGAELNYLRPVDYEYNAIDQVTSMTVYNWRASDNPTSGNPPRQTTTYIYGITRSGYNAINSKSLLSAVLQPGATGERDWNGSEAYFYNALGETVLKRDRGSTQHNYAYDAAGRVISDGIAFPTPGLDTSITSLTTEYDALGRAVTLSSWGKDSYGTFRILNQVKREYDGFGRTKREYQEHLREVQLQEPVSYFTEFVYNSANPTRLEKIVYPNTRALFYSYDDFGRVSAIVDDNGSGSPGQTLEQYSYLGAASVVGRVRPQQNAQQTTTLDSLGRASTYSWTTTGGFPLAQYAYAYGLGGSLKSRKDLVAVAAGHAELGEEYWFDRLGRRTKFVRGKLTGEGIGAHIGDDDDVEYISATWTVDAQGNKYGGVYGTAYTLKNEPAAEAGNYNPNGTTARVSLDHDAALLMYDAWGRVAQVKASTSEGPTQTYRYDAAGRVIISESRPTGGNLFTTRHLYAGNQLIEDRGDAGQLLAQYVWGADGGTSPILRDRDSNLVVNSPPVAGIPNRNAGDDLDERLYSITDAEGNVTAIASMSGDILERYSYLSDGKVEVRDPGFNLVLGGVPQRAWPFLYHGQMRVEIVPQYTHTTPGGQNWAGTSTTRRAQSLYRDAIGNNWYDPNDGRLIQPDQAAPAGWNPYDPTKGMSTVEAFVSQHGETIAMVGIGAASLALAPFTFGGSLAVGIGAMSVLRAATRYDEGQSLGASLLGGFGDGVPGLQSLWRAATGEDLGTGDDLGMSFDQRLASGGAGLLDAGLTLLGLRYASAASAVARTVPRSCRVLSAAGGAVIGGSIGAGVGATSGLLNGYAATGQWSLDAAMQGAIFGGSFGAIAGGINGWRNPRVCFVAGTQVVVGLKVEEEDGRIIELSARELARRQAAEVESGGVATALKIVGYVTAAIETLKECDYVISRDQNDPDGPLVGMPITRKYRRIADHLQVLDVEDAGLSRQTIFTTDEHPFHVPGRNWTQSRLLVIGDGLTGPADVSSSVTGNTRQSHPAGVVVYNMEVEGTHTYFVRAAGSNGEPVWVHNAEPGYARAKQDALRDIDDFYANEVFEGRLDPAIPERYLNPANRPPYAAGQVEAVWQNGLLEGNGRVFDRFTGAKLSWNKALPRDGQWDMGHIKSYKSMHAKLLNGEMNWGEFMDWYHDPASYLPQSIPSNRGRLGGI